MRNVNYLAFHPNTKYQLFLSAFLLFLSACVPLDGFPPIVGSSPVDLSGIDPALSRVDDVSSLKRYLASDARWKLTIQEGDVVAQRRSPKDERWDVGLHGFNSNAPFEEYFLWRLILRFSYDTSENYWEDWVPRFNSTICNASPDNCRVDLEWGPTSGFRSYQSNLLILTKGPVFVEVYESSTQRERKYTEQLLLDLGQELENLSSTQFESNVLGCPSLIGTRQADILHPESLEVLERDELIVDGDQGIYSVYGYVNAGEPGKIFIDVIKVDTGEHVIPDRYKDRTIEYIGWSKCPDERFYYGAEVLLTSSGSREFYEAEFQLWFEPEQSGSPHLLTKSTHEVIDWQR